MLVLGAGDVLCGGWTGIGCFSSVDLSGFYARATDCKFRLLSAYA